MEPEEQNRVLCSSSGHTESSLSQSNSYWLNKRTSTSDPLRYNIISTVAMTKYSFCICYEGNDSSGEKPEYYYFLIPLLAMGSLYSGEVEAIAGVPGQMKNREAL